MDKPVELLEGGFSTNSRFIGFISARRCWFMDMAGESSSTCVRLPCQSFAKSLLSLLTIYLLSLCD